MNNNLSFSFLTFSCLILLKSILYTYKPLLAQTNNSIPTIKQQNIIPRDTTPNSFPETTPKQQQQLPELLPSSETNPEQEKNNDLGNTLINVSYFEFSGNTVFTQEQLNRINIEVPFLEPQTTIEKIKNRKLSINQLIEIAQIVANYYQTEGYQTSGQ